MVLASDVSETYVLYLYKDIQFITELTIVGFNAGDGIRSYTLPDSDVLNLTATSNVGYPGVHMFRVDQNDIAGMPLSMWAVVMRDYCTCSPRSLPGYAM